jgi:hypothetical protein
MTVFELIEEANMHLQNGGKFEIAQGIEMVAKVVHELTYLDKDLYDDIEMED